MHNGQCDLAEGLEEPFSGRVIDALPEVLGEQAHQLLLVLFEIAADYEFHQGEEAEGNAQQMGQADHLVVTFDKEWVER
jgi:hypothetical protein